MNRTYSTRLFDFSGTETGYSPRTETHPGFSWTPWRTNDDGRFFRVTQRTSPSWLDWLIVLGSAAFFAAAAVAAIVGNRVQGKPVPQALWVLGPIPVLLGMTAIVYAFVLHYYMHDKHPDLLVADRDSSMIELPCHNGRTVRRGEVKRLEIIDHQVWPARRSGHISRCHHVVFCLARDDGTLEWLMLDRGSMSKCFMGRRIARGLGIPCVEIVVQEKNQRA